MLITSGLSAQTNRISTLKAVVSHAKNDAEKLNAILVLCEETESLHSDTLYQYALAAKNMALATHNNEAFRKAVYYEAYSYYHKNLLDSVSALIAEHGPKLKKEFPASTANPLFDLLEGRYLTRKQQYKEALALYYSVLNEAEKRKDTLNQVRAIAGIGNVLNRTKDHDGALSWFLKGIAAGSAYRNKTAYLYTNVAVLYTRKENYDSARLMVLKGIQYAREAENLGDLASALGMYSGLQMDIAEHSGGGPAKYAAAEKPLREALAITEKIGEVNDILTNMGSLGIFYYDTKQYQKGVDICLQAINLIEQYHFTSKLAYTYEILANNYKELHKYKEQADVLSKLVELNESMYQVNSAEAMSELKTKYEVQKKENTIILQQLALVKKDYLIYSSVLFLVLVVLVIYFAFRNYKKREKLKAQLSIASAEESERKRIAADLHDNLGAYAASIASNLNRLSFSSDNSSEAAALQEVRLNSNAIVSDLSDTIWALKKESLPLTAVSDRLKIFIQRVQNSYPGISIDVEEDITKDHSLSPSQGFHLFQTLQEAINNALKHSHCSHILISVNGREHFWEIRIQDNGTGMQDTTTDTGGGNGLFNMRNRATEAGWNIAWEAAEPHGTTVIISQAVD
ncbi:MAG: ATP-binding protein [Bacteroidota bacterium]